MKNIVLAGMLAVASFGAFAKPPSPDCIARSQIFTIAAINRDAGRPPQYALDMIISKNFQLTGEGGYDNSMFKNMVNWVYFTPENAFPAQVLSARILDACMNERPKYEPLK